MKACARVFTIVLLGVGVTIALCSRASAQQGFYADIHSGLSLFDDAQTRVVVPDEANLHAHTNYDPGWLVGAAGGYDWPFGLALEEEFTFRDSKIDRIATDVPLLKDGEAYSYAMMTNGYYRYHNSTPFTPYIGGGVGEAVVQLSNLKPVGAVGTYGGTDAEFAYQGIAGVEYRLTPQLSLGAEYRYFATIRPGFVSSVAGVDNVHVSPDYRSNNAMLKMVYHFE
jgi:OOP family OmpA-OmpF porin